MMWELIKELAKSIYKDLKGEPIFYVHEHTPKTLGTPIRKE